MSAGVIAPHRRIPPGVGTTPTVWLDLSFGVAVRNDEATQGTGSRAEYPGEAKIRETKRKSFELLRRSVADGQREKGRIRWREKIETSIFRFESETDKINRANGKLEGIYLSGSNP